MSTAKTFGATYTYVFNAKLVKLHEKLQKIVLYHNCTVQKILSTSGGHATNVSHRDK